MSKIIGVTTATPYAGTPKKIWASIYSDNSPEWVEHSEANLHIGMFGKDILFKGDFTKGKTYLCRVWIESKEETEGSTSMGIGCCRPDTLIEYVCGDATLFYNADLGCYEAEFVAWETLQDDEMCLFVGYPYIHKGGIDRTATFGKAIILCKDNLQNIVNMQNDKIASIGSDIESALDGIITIQENLIGGGSV